MAGLAGLVAYDGSSGSGSDDEDDAGPQKVSNAPSASSSSRSTIATALNEEQLEKRRQAFSLRFEEFLPKPKIGVEVDDDEGHAGVPIVVDVQEIGPIPPKKVYGDEEAPPPPRAAAGGASARMIGIGDGEGRTEVTATRTAKGVMRISIPSLKQFEDDEDTAEDLQRRKKFLPSGSQKKGSGLFAILPEPKGATISASTSFSKANSSGQGQGPAQSSSSAVSSSSSTSKPAFSLIPHAVQQSLSGKRPAEIPISEKLAQVRAKYMKQESNFKIVSNSSSSSKKVKPKKPKNDNDSDSDDSSDDDDGKPMDFFSLDESANQVDLSGVNLDDFRVEDKTANSRPAVEENDDSDDDEMEVDDEDELPKPNFEDSNFAAEAAQAQAQQAEDLMKYIQPERKYKGKAQQPPINIIDVHADDLRPASTDWLKTITDKSMIAPRKANLPGGMSKRKHQITYLAAEAKAREEELQNQWAHNRHSKRQTQSKYGF